MSKNDMVMVPRDVLETYLSAPDDGESFEVLYGIIRSPTEQEKFNPVAWMVHREDGSLEGIHTEPRCTDHASYYRMKVTPLYTQADPGEVDPTLSKLAEAAIAEMRESGQRWPQDDDWFEPGYNSAEMQFIRAASPEEILRLLKVLANQESLL